jgi:epoxyqueuosine reductase
MPEEYRIAMGDRIYGCDSCIEVCPPGGKLLRKATEPLGRFGLESILASSDQTLLVLFGNWFIPNRDPRVVRRNALIAAGNSESQTLVSAVSMYVAHPDWVLRAHAAWALRRIGGTGAEAVLLQRKSAEADPRVRSELV